MILDYSIFSKLKSLCSISILYVPLYKTVCSIWANWNKMYWAASFYGMDVCIVFPYIHLKNLFIYLYTYYIWKARYMLKMPLILEKGNGVFWA